jgi:UDP-GlcNAc:undecaprenyl-phosphate GlcNAc-1-phosphate transferase
MTVLLQQMALVALVSGVLAVSLTPLVKRLAVRAGVVRAPRARDVHERPTPLWGGLAMYAAFVLTTLLLVKPLIGHAAYAFTGSGARPILGILLGGTIIALVGLLDDKYDLSPLRQTAGLVGGGVVAALLGVSIQGITNPFAPPSPRGGFTSENYLALGPWSIPLTVAWIFLVAKTFDFLDGLDGLAAGVCAISSATIGLLAAARGDLSVALMSAALTGACVGFLRHNYNPASIFMGTIGGQFLGFVLAALSIVGGFKIPAAISVLIPLLVLGVPVFDGLLVIGKRIWRRQAPQVADRTSHIHHRLRNRGLSVQQTVWAVYALTASCCVAALLLAWRFGPK